MSFNLSIGGASYYVASVSGSVGGMSQENATSPIHFIELSPGITYSITVQARNMQGSSEPSTPIYLTTGLF